MIPETLVPGLDFETLHSIANLNRASQSRYCSVAGVRLPREQAVWPDLLSGGVSIKCYG